MTEELIEAEEENISFDYICKHCNEVIKVGEKAVEVSYGAISSYNIFRKFDYPESFYYHRDCYKAILLGGK